MLFIIFKIAAQSLMNLELESVFKLAILKIVKIQGNKISDFWSKWPSLLHFCYSTDFCFFVWYQVKIWNDLTDHKCEMKIDFPP